MCPDRQILSVYFDGELDSPWKEKCEKHLEECPSCRARLESYGRTRQKLSAVSPLERESIENSMERIWGKNSFTALPRRKTFWNGSLSVPLPAAAAAAILIMVLTTAVLLVSRPAVKPGDPQLAGLEVQDMVPVPDMASLLQYLGGDNSPDMVIIRLPDTATFRNAGEPQILRAADYSGIPNSGSGSPR